MAIIITGTDTPTIVSDLLKGALRVATVIGRGFTPSAEDYSDALEACNQMLNSWSARQVLVPYRTRESFTPSASQASYTFGDGGDFDSQRPIAIEGITVTAGGADHPLNEMDLAQYNALPVKTTQGIPSNYYFEPTYSTSTIYFDYKPSTSYTITIDSIFQQIGDQVSLPPGYDEAIKFNLAVRLCTEYGRPIPPAVAALAQESYNAIYAQSMGLRKVYMSVDPGLQTHGASYNILRDS